MVRSFFGFGLIAAVIAGLLGLFLWDLVGLHPYLIWIISLSGATFVLYGLDKRLSKEKGRRSPNRLLHLLTLAGGVFGAWPGRLAFNHKTNLKENFWYLFWLLVGLVLHALLIYTLFFRLNRPLLGLTPALPAV